MKPNKFIKIIAAGLTLHVAYVFSEGLYPCKFAITNDQKKACPLHLAYLQNEALTLNQVTTALKDVNPSTGQRNLVSLTSYAYSRNADAFTDSFKEIPGIKYLKIRVKRREDAENKRVRFSFRLMGMPLALKSIEQIQLVRNQDQKTILNKEKAIGEYEEGSDSSDGENYFLFSEDFHRTPVADGAYTLTVRMKGQAALTQEIVIHNLAASRSPEVTFPGSHSVLTDGNPTIQFEDFKSPEYQKHEKRRVHISVMKAADDLVDTVYEARLVAGGITKIRLGDQTVGKGVSKLLPGKYMLRVQFRERSVQGDLDLEREAGTYVPMEIR